MYSRTGLQRLIKAVANQYSQRHIGAGHIFNCSCSLLMLIHRELQAVARRRPLIIPIIATLNHRLSHPSVTPRTPQAPERVPAIIKLIRTALVELVRYPLQIPSHEYHSRPRAQQRRNKHASIDHVCLFSRESLRYIFQKQNGSKSSEIMML